MNIPNVSRRTLSNLSAYLRTEGFTGTVNDILKKWLRVEGFEGTINDSFNAYLSSLGFTGTINDKIRKWGMNELKNFITLERTANAYYQLSEPLTFAGDFEIEFEFSTSTTGTSYSKLLSTATNSSDGFVLYISHSDGSLNLRTASGGNYEFRGLSGSYDDGKLNTLRMKRTGDLIEFSVNRDASVSFIKANLLADISIIAGTFGEFFNGIISNVKLTDLSTPTNSLTFGLDELTQNFELAEQNVLGANIVVNSDFSDGLTGWAKNSSGGTLTAVNNVLTMASDSEPNQNALQTVLGTTSRPFLVTIDINVVAGRGRVDLDNVNGIGDGAGNVTGGEISPSGWNTYTFVGVFNNNTAVIQVFALGSNSITQARNISIREISDIPYINYINIAQTQDVRDTYNLIDGRFFGSELVVNGDFENGLAGWNTTGDASATLITGSGFSGNAAKITRIANGALTQNMGVVASNSYLVSALYRASAGSSSIAAGGGNNQSFAINTGDAVKYSYVSTGGDGVATFIVPSAGSTFEVDNVSVKRIIDVAEKIVPEIVLTTLINLERTANAYYQLSEPVTFAGDFEIELDFVTTTSDNITLIGGTTGASGTGTLIVRVASSGVAQVRFNDSLLTGTTIVNDGKLHTLKATQSSGVTAFFIDGVFEATETQPQVAHAVTRFGFRDDSFQLFNGIISNVKLKDLATPSNSLTFGLDELTGNIELPDENVFGSEEIVNGYFSDGTVDWISGRNAVLSESSGRLRVTNTDLTSGYGYQEIEVEAGKHYLVKLTGYSGTRPTDIRIGAGGGSSVYYRDFGSVSPKVLETILTSTGTILSVALFINGGAEGDYCEWDNVSVKEVSIPNLITYNNIAETKDVRDTYTLFEGEYTGTELVVNGGFATDTDWTKGSGWSISDGKATYESNGADTTFSQFNVMDVGKTYNININCLSLTSDLGGRILLRNPASTSILPVIISSGNFEYVTVAQTKELILRGERTDTIAEIDNVSVKRIIEVAQ
jgi:hypothetical protein